MNTGSFVLCLCDLSDDITIHFFLFFDSLYNPMTEINDFITSSDFAEVVVLYKYLPKRSRRKVGF